MSKARSGEAPSFFDDDDFDGDELVTPPTFDFDDDDFDEDQQPPPPSSYRDFNEGEGSDEDQQPPPPSYSDFEEEDPEYHDEIVPYVPPVDRETALRKENEALGLVIKNQLAKIAALRKMAITLL